MKLQARVRPTPKSQNGPSIAVVKPSGKAVRPTYVEGGKGLHLSRPAPGTGPLLPSRTGKPWPGGGKVPPPDTGNQDAIRVGYRHVTVTPGGASVHYHRDMPSRSA